VQEALTNALKHSAAGSARVGVDYGAATLDIEVEDDGGASDREAAPSGHGLVGLRERTRLVGGTLDYGPCAGGGFRVRASLPAPWVEAAT
jgi:signal transduction histidine kinase